MEKKSKKSLSSRESLSRKVVMRDLTRDLRIFVSDGRGNERKEIRRSRITNFRDDRSLFNNGNNRAFTLIELLVVVLIIGILAAVALPQYKMAVDKARLGNLMTMLKSVANAEEAYYLANGKYTNQWDELSVDFAGNTTSYWVSNSNDTLYANEWRITLASPQTGAVAAANTKISGVGLRYFYSTHPWHGFACYATATNAHANQLCKNLTKKITPDSHGTAEPNIYFFK